MVAFFPTAGWRVLLVRPALFYDFCGLPVIYVYPAHEFHATSDRGRPNLFAMGDDNVFPSKNTTN
jgi:hypothetical protein